MPRALNLLRQAVHYRHDAFSAGLQAAGLTLVPSLPDPRPGDVLLLWNRYGGQHEQADAFERAGATALVAENCFFGNDWRGDRWYSLARSQPAMVGGDFRPGGPARWDSWLHPLHPWRGGDTALVLAQRGIGNPNTASPLRWAEHVAARFGARVRPHPGTDTKARPLEEDLHGVSSVITWASAAAVQALALGVAVWYRHPGFIMAGAGRELSEFAQRSPRQDDTARLDAFRRAAWAIWTLDEVRSGEPIRRLL